MRWFCSFKAYGDLIIACNSLRNVDTAQNGLLVGMHLCPLLDAIEFDGTLCVLESGKNIPALFDIKMNRVSSIISNGFLLRKKIQAAVRQKDDLLVFDALGVRQYFLAWPMRVEAVAQGMDNIYLDYARYFNFTGEGTVPVLHNAVKPGGKVCIFPDSRLKYKELPDWLVANIARENNKHGKETLVVKVGKPVALPQFDSIQLKWIDGLDQLVAMVREANFLVSADSLPAHLAEYFGINVFVFTPGMNGYWMPLSSFKNGYFSGFDTLMRYEKWINHI